MAKASAKTETTTETIPEVVNVSAEPKAVRKARFVTYSEKQREDIKLLTRSERLKYLFKCFSMLRERRDMPAVADVFPEKVKITSNTEAS